MNKGIFITIEGTDGSGKSTQIRNIKSYLSEKGLDVLLVREPGGTQIGEKIRSIILDSHNNEMSFITEMLLYASARAQIISEVIKPALDNNKVVICDRFVDSSYVYQGIGRGIGLDIVQNVNNIAMDGIKPDITFFLDIDPEIALNRRHFSSFDRIESESLEFHRKVYLGYKKLADIFPDRIKTINSDRDYIVVFNDIKQHLEMLIAPSK